MTDRPLNSGGFADFSLTETLAEARRAEQPEPEAEEPPTLEELIRHCGMAGEDGCSDGWIATDFDAVLSVARPEDQLALRRYRKLRMAHPSFKRRSTTRRRPTRTGR